MMPVSLSRTGLPRFILPRHRNMFWKDDRVAMWVRLYATIFQVYKLILIPTEVDVSSITTPRAGAGGPLFLC